MNTMQRENQKDTAEQLRINSQREGISRQLNLGFPCPTLNMKYQKVA